MFQFSSNLQRVKKVTIEYAKKKYNTSQKNITKVEDKIASMFLKNSNGVFCEMDTWFS